MTKSTNPPGPGFWEAMQTGRSFRRDALATLQDWHRRFGDIAYFGLGGWRFYWLFHPDLVREVLIAQAKKFRRTGRQVDVLREWDGEGLVTSDGDFWLRQRRLVQPAFHPQRFAGYATQMTSAAANLVERWRRERPAQVELNSAMTDLTMEIIAATLFGTNLSPSSAQLGRAVAELSAYAMREIGKPFSLPNWLPLPSIRRKLTAIRFLHQTIDRLVSERRGSQEDRSDLLSMLLAARDEEGDGKGLTDEQLRHELMTLFLAGHDTTAGTLPWAFYLLARHPDAEARLRDELATVLNGRRPAAEDVPKLPYANMAVKETLRLYPQAYVLFARVAAEDLVLNGHAIPKGSQLFPVPYVIHRDAKWHADPERFDPERFSPERFDQLPSCAWFPFGAGPRACIGSAFATMEMVLILATVLPQMKLSIVPGQPPPTPHPTVSLRPKGGLWMSLTPVD